MAAGLGFKDFVTGEVLTAADVDGYLMQGVWVFASATARDAAVTSPQEGNFAYLKDTNVTTYYTGSAWANLDTTGMTNPMTTTGDTIYSSSGSTPARLGIGTAGQVLQVNSGATAPEWATPSSGASFAGVKLQKSSGGFVTIANNTSTKVTGYDSEVYDVGGYSAGGTTITIPAGKAGYYNIQAAGYWDQNATGTRESLIKKNGSTIISALDVYTAQITGTPNFPYMVQQCTVYLAVADYVEVFVKQNSGGNLGYWVADPFYFTATYLGA